MIFRVEHRTRYVYGSAVPVARCLLRMTPTSRAGQTVTQARLDIAPEPDRRVDEVDAFGNAVTRVEYASPHTELNLHSLALVRVERDEPPMPALTPRWEAVAAAAAAVSDLTGDAPAHALHPSVHVPLLPEATAILARSFGAGRPVLAAAIEVAQRIKADFAYDPTATDVSTPLAQVVAERRGVCQDFAHVMIAGLRGLGLPARYVSGYLRTTPPPGEERLVGADATHAWVELWCGAAEGWIGLDPTNGIFVGNDHVVVAVGRDYADVAPVAGIIRASGDHRLEVAVDVTAAGERDALALVAG